jgi:hypothetical protein
MQGPPIHCKTPQPKKGALELQILAKDIICHHRNEELGNVHGGPAGIAEMDLEMSGEIRNMK